MGRVKFENAPPQYREENKYVSKYPIPTTLIGQLGVDETVQGEGLGEFLLVRAIAVASFTSREKVGAAAVEVHAATERSRSFFERYGFLRMQDSEDHLFMSILKADEVADQVQSTTIPGQLGG